MKLRLFPPQTGQSSPTLVGWAFATASFDEVTLSAVCAEQTKTINDNAKVMLGQRMISLDAAGCEMFLGRLETSDPGYCDVHSPPKETEDSDANCNQQGGPGKRNVTGLGPILATEGRLSIG
jgi:hypothetical protein